MQQVTDRAMVNRWLARYEAAWQASGAGCLAGRYHLPQPYEQHITSLDATKRMWEEEREGPDEA
jgi:hypothetical protein